MARVVIEEKIAHLIEKSVQSLLHSYSEEKDFSRFPAVCLDIPKDEDHGDLTTNIAMRLTRYVKMNPMSIAEKLRELISGELKKSALSGFIKQIDVIKPGFVNFWFSEYYLRHVLLAVKKEGVGYGRSAQGGGRKIQIEFVSANPTGPLTIAHGRQAAIGNALSNILEFYGYRTVKEYFINDEGNQINTLGESILCHYLSFYGINREFPEDGYRGDYIREIAEEIKGKNGDRFVKNCSEYRKFFSDYGVKYMMDMIRKDLDAFGIKFDSWFSQKVLTKDKINGTLNYLRGKGFIYDKDGAVWFKSSSMGDEKDRVVVKSDGAFTYFAPDIAYHQIKYRKGFDRIVNIWGPDHHGYVPRIKAAVRALGHDDNSVSVLLVQLATLYRDGKVLSMSTRKGEFVTLREVFEETGKDVAKFFFLMRKLDSHLDFDLEVAKHQSADNPVYYVQYAHARIWSIFNFGKKMKRKLMFHRTDLRLLKEKEELALARTLAQFPTYVRDAARGLEPYYIVFYLNTLATVFHNFYTKHRVVIDDPGL